MKKNNVICPACGSTSVERSEYENSDQLTLGPEFVFNQVNYKCSSCGEEGDFAAETDKNFIAAQKNAQEGLVKNVVEDLANKNISMAYFERVFELPIRTLTRWKTGDFSSSAIALLRIVKTFPWVAEAAEHRFDPSFSRAILVREAANVLGRMADEIPGATFQFQVKSEQTQVRAIASFIAPTKTENFVSNTPLAIAAGG